MRKNGSTLKGLNVNKGFVFNQIGKCYKFMKMKYTTYKNLLEVAEQEYDTFSLVWRHELNFEESAWKIEEELRPHLLSKFSSCKWPGTEIFGRKATIRTYVVNPESISILGRVSSVFDWLAPNYPEDLAFYRENKVIFASVAHEGEAWFET
jgi:hypothetical protein